MTIVGKSWNDENTWFIFRGNGDEVKVVIDNNLIKPGTELTLEEVNHIRENILTKN